MPLEADNTATLKDTVVNPEPAAAPVAEAAPAEAAPIRIVEDVPRRLQR